MEWTVAINFGLNYTWNEELVGKVVSWCTSLRMCKVILYRLGALEVHSFWTPNRYGYVAKNYFKIFPIRKCSKKSLPLRAAHPPGIRNGGQALDALRKWRQKQPEVEELPAPSRVPNLKTWRGNRWRFVACRCWWSDPYLFQIIGNKMEELNLYRWTSLRSCDWWWFLC